MVNVVCIICYFVFSFLSRSLIYQEQYVLSYLVKILQMIVSAPVMYNLLSKRVKNKKLLWCGIILFNVFWAILGLLIYIKEGYI